MGITGLLNPELNFFNQKGGNHLFHPAYRNQNLGGLPIWFLISLEIFKSDAFP